MRAGAAGAGVALAFAAVAGARSHID